MTSNSILFRALACGMISVLLTACDPTTPTERNNTADSGRTSTTCGSEGELAMLAAPVNIATRSETNCERITLSLKTSVVLRDDYHALAGICTEKLFPELYYALDSSLLLGLERLAASGANFQLPSGVGRLVQTRSISPNRRNYSAAFYISEGRNYSPNRVEYTVQLPGFVADFNSANSVQQNSIRNGQTVFYMWAKRINKESDIDPMRFSKTIERVVYRTANTINAGSDQTITLPQQRSITLRATLNDNNRSFNQASINWKWIRKNFGPQIDPDIFNVDQLSTNVRINDFGNHLFEFSITDNCNRIYRDTVLINVRGELNPSDNLNNVILHGASCSRNGEGRIASINNLSTQNSFLVRVAHTNDLRSWLDNRTSGAGTIMHDTTDYFMRPAEVRELGCSVSQGSDGNGSDISRESWRIISETRR